MKFINYILQGFGFTHFQDYIKSTFGFVYTSGYLIKWDVVFGLIFSSFPLLFGFNHLFFYAFVFLALVEWITGIKASFKRNEVHESRKFGRMLLKLATYFTLIHILNLFHQNTQFPEISGFELDPFAWLYWAALIAIIWQLLVSVLENLKTLGFKFAEILLKIINKKFYEQFNLNDDEKDNSTTD